MAPNTYRLKYFFIIQDQTLSIFRRKFASQYVVDTSPLQSLPPALFHSTEISSPPGALTCGVYRDSSFGGADDSNEISFGRFSPARETASSRHMSID